jgi:hypothetical protein
MPVKLEALTEWNSATARRRKVAAADLLEDCAPPSVASGESLIQPHLFVSVIQTLTQLCRETAVNWVLKPHTVSPPQVKGGFPVRGDTKTRDVRPLVAGNALLDRAFASARRRRLRHQATVEVDDAPHRRRPGGLVCIPEVLGPRSNDVPV